VAVAKFENRNYRKGFLTEEQMAAGVRAASMAEPAIGYMLVLYGAVRAGHAAAVTEELKKVAARPPETFRDFARKNAGAWRAA
jgi:hypothetical protein